MSVMASQIPATRLLVQQYAQIDSAENIKVLKFKLVKEFPRTMQRASDG